MGKHTTHNPKSNITPKCMHKSANTYTVQQHTCSILVPSLSLPSLSAAPPGMTWIEWERRERERVGEERERERERRERGKV